MFKKLEDIEISKENPFDEKDKLGRGEIAENLSKIITSGKGPLVLSVNAPWGFGKTTFVKMWKQKLENDKYPCIYFNAWENDFAESPFHSFLGEIQESLVGSLGGATDQTKLKVHGKRLVSLGGKLLKSFVPMLVSLATSGILNLKNENLQKEISEVMETFAEQRIKEYQEEKRTIQEFKKTLKEFAEAFKEEKGETLPIIIFVDELDRCRPNYAIELLENIKHLFSVEGYVFVLSLDREQLAHSVRSVYGEGMDADGYLRRFIDLEFNMPSPDMTKYCKFLYEDFYKIKFDLNQKYGSDPDACKILCKSLEVIPSYLQMDLRSAGQAYGNIKILIKMFDLDWFYYHSFFFLVFLKLKRTDLYHAFRKDRMKGNALWKQIESEFGPVDFKKNRERFWVHIYGFLFCSDCSSEQVDKKIRELKEDIRHKTVTDSPEDTTIEEMKAMVFKDYYLDANDIKKSIVKSIEFASQFDSTVL